MQTSQRQQDANWVTPDNILPTLTAALTRVRPASMSDNAATDWLAVAAADLTGYRRDHVLAALDAAKRKCRFHNEILPFVFDYLDEAANRYNYTGRKQPERYLPRQEAPPQIAGLIANAAKALSAST